MFFSLHCIQYNTIQYNTIFEVRMVIKIGQKYVHIHIHMQTHIQNIENKNKMFSKFFNK